MVNLLKLELVKILLHQKRNKIYQVIHSLENISYFIEGCGNPTSFLKENLNEDEIVKVGNYFYHLYEIIEAGINMNLRVEFNRISDEFSSETIYSCSEMLDQLITELQFYELKRLEDAIEKVDANINRLKNN